MGVVGMHYGKIIYPLFFLFFIVGSVSGTLTISTPTPADNAVVVDPENMVLGVTVNDSNKGIINITFYTNSSGLWDYFYMGYEDLTFANVSANGTYIFKPLYFTQYDKTYKWNVSIDNGTDDNVQGGPYTFSTMSAKSNDAVGGTGGSGDAMSIAGGALCLSILGVIAFIRRRRDRYS